MEAPDALGYTTIPLAYGSGAIHAVGSAMLIPDFLAKQARKAAQEAGHRRPDCAERASGSSPCDGCPT